ncbi:MAG: OB-fold domain-containing protein [Promethearchaeota archaeon]|nr:MAG: OB-fold domain-containing protein [Candidatus Lokiarchaeota archaeon]
MNVPEKIIWKKCKNCGFLQHKTHLRCLKCKKTEFDKIEASGSCKLLTYTILKAPPAEFRDKPSYVLGVVEFENGIKGLGQITTQGNLKTGMQLKPVYRKICNNLNDTEVYSYMFKPLE